MLKIENIKKIYRSRLGTNQYEALRGLSFNVSEGEFLSIMGPSGSGKTTLLNIIGTIDVLTSGKIFVNDVDITSLNKKELAKFRRSNIGFIFQDYNLLDTLTLEENILLPLLLGDQNNKKGKNNILKIAKDLGIDKVIDKYPYEVSGGEKQRAAAARAIITNPSIILADEPTGNLDSKSARELLELFTFLNKKYKLTILLVTHDIYAASYSNRVLFIRDGKLFNELNKDGDRKTFFDQIIDFEGTIGGDN